MNTRKECRKFVRDVKVTTPPVGMNRRSSMEGEDLFREFRSKSIPDAVDHPYFSDGYVSESSTYRRPSRSDTIDLVNIKSPAPSNPENQAWVLGVPTKTDPGVLMCLSKKQSEMKIEPNSADAILDLHNKYLERVTSADIGAVPKPRKPNKDYEYISDSDGTDRVESLYKTEIRKTERSKPGSDDVKFRKTLESWEDPEYSSDDRTKRLLRNELLRTCKSSCSIPYSLDTEKKDENMDMSSIDRLHRLYKSEMRLAQPNKELSMKRNIVCPKTDDSWIKIYDASNYEESIQNRLKSDKSIHQNIIDKSSTLSLNEQDLRKKDDVDRRRFSLPKELHEKQMQYILEKERQIQKEIDKLQHEKELLKLEELAVKTRRKSDDAKVDKRSKNRIFDSKIQVLDEISELDDCVERLERLAEEAKKVDEAKSKADDHKMPNKKYRDLFGELTPHQRLLKEIEEIENLQYPLPRSIDNDFYELKEKSAESQVIFNKMYEANQKNDEDKPNPFKKYIGEDFDDLLKNVSVHPKSKITKSFSQYDVSKIKEEESEKSRSNFDINLDRSKTSKKVDLKSPEEKLREQMYSEYMSKVAEREYRKHQHVIKLSKIHQEEITSSSPLKPKYDIHASTRIENEFMQELKKRHDKLGIHDDEDSSGDQLASVPNLKVFDGSEVDVCDGNKLPKHLLEFAKLTTDLDDDHSVLHVREDSQNLTCFHEQFSGVTINPNVSPKLLEESRKSFKEVTEFQNLLSDVSDEESSRLFDLLVSEDKPGASKVAQDAKEGQISSNGIWSPGSSHSQSVDHPDKSEKEPSPPIAPIWTPRSAQASPVVERKEFRPVSFESPTLPRRKTETPQTTPPVAPPWQNGTSSAPAPSFSAPSFTTTPSSPISLPAPPPPPPAPPTLSDNLNTAVDRKLSSSRSAPVDLQQEEAKSPFTFQDKKKFFSSVSSGENLQHKKFSSGSNLQEKKNLFTSTSGSNLQQDKRSFSSGSGVGLAGLAGSTPVSESSYTKFPGSTEKGLFTKKSEEFSKVIKEYKSTSRNSELLSEEKREERFHSSSGDPIPVLPVIDPVGSFGEVIASSGPKFSSNTGLSSGTKFGSDTGLNTSFSTGITSNISSTSATTNNVSAKLPKVQNPTITLLQKAREGHLPKGASYLEEGPKISKDPNPKSSGGLSPGEIIYSLKKEYTEPPASEQKPQKMVDLGPRKFEGIGPTTKDGMPIVLRSEVKENNQAKWYKRMYDTIHKSPNDDFVTVRYKTRRGRYPHYSSCSRPGSSLGSGEGRRNLANGYASEPEPALGYDSDYYCEDRNGTGARSSSRTDSRYEQNIYKNQPGRIEDYTPGRSSLAERETKQWWDEVMDIFDGHLEQQQKYGTTINSKSYGHLSRALQEQGYESDSQLLRRRNGDMTSPAPLSPPQQREAYRNLQAGGDPPLQGFRKPAPERPKESPYRYVDGEVTIHYRSPVRREALDAWSEEELARRQAEAMRRRYQEERRRKYLQELQDMNSRRHTDNFTPDQKSPIPLNRFDDFVGAEPAIASEPKGRPERRIVARALYNFQGQSARELSFRKGDLIYVRRQLDRNWYEGEHNAAVGMFPYNYVEILPHDGARPQVQRKPVEGQARAKFNFIAQTNLELSLLKGELVTLTRRVDENWFEGRINNKRGIFPVSYVEVLADIGSSTAPPPPLDTAKPVASPAAHSLMTNGARHQSMGSHHYVPPPCPGIGHLAGGGGSGGTGSLHRARPVSVENALTVDTRNEPVAYRALYKYKPQNSDELELAEGDIVYVLEKCDDGWYVGSSQRTGCFGTFPGNYVEKS